MTSASSGLRSSRKKKWRGNGWIYQGLLTVTSHGLEQTVFYRWCSLFFWVHTHYTVTQVCFWRLEINSIFFYVTSWGKTVQSHPAAQELPLKSPRWPQQKSQLNSCPPLPPHLGKWPLHRHTFPSNSESFALGSTAWLRLMRRLPWLQWSQKPM